jgi:hypothetical protein
LHEEHVNVPDVQLGERGAQGCGGFMVPGGPELGDDGDFGARDAGVANRPPDNVLCAIDLRRVDGAVS